MAEMTVDNQGAFQDYYADDFAHCYGCGRLNKEGMQIKSYWDGDEGVCHVLPHERYTGATKQIMYGGLIASLIDCHGAATAAAYKARELSVTLEPGALPRFVTASLKVDYIAPTPIGVEIELRSNVKTMEGRKVTVAVTLSAENTVCAKGELLLIQLRDQKK